MINHRFTSKLDYTRSDVTVLVDWALKQTNKLLTYLLTRSQSYTLSFVGSEKSVCVHNLGKTP